MIWEILLAASLWAGQGTGGVPAGEKVDGAPAPRAAAADDPAAKLLPKKKAPAGAKRRLDPAARESPAPGAAQPKNAPGTAAKKASSKVPAAAAATAAPVAPRQPSISAPRALAQAPAPGADLSKCVTCHAPLTADRKVHPILEDGDCSACHAPSPGAVGKCRSPAGSAWKLASEQPALCVQCHDAPKGTAHPVIELQGCTACHDPHASSNRKLLKILPVEALCYKCHEKFDDAAFVHTPVKGGECLGCHNPHGSANKPLLVKKREALCAECHDVKDLTKGHDKHVPVVEGRCTECHDPHRGKNKAQILATGEKLCLTCHDVKAKPGPATASSSFRIDLSKKVVHAAISGGDCQDCHTQQHSSENPSLLRKPVLETCFTCHTKFDELYKFQHSAARLGECAVCHDPHSSDNKGLLTAATINEICFKCHADDATSRKWVHKPIVQKGCTACHDAHGADNRYNLADADRRTLCLKCHAGVGQKVKVKHAALERYGCTVCHTPHASDNPKGLLKPVNLVCTSCHAQQADGGHLKTFNGRHPIVGVPDPRRKDEKLSCVSCHAPHGSDNPKLFVAGSTPQEACKGCH